MKKEDISVMHQYLLEDLCYFRDKCDSYGIEFFLATGTLLGAIRHNGFIPWDTDLDVMMTRNNFDLLMTHRNEFNSNIYQISTFRDDPSMPTIYAHFIDKRAIFCTQEFGTNLDYLHIDIYVCDYIKESIFARTALVEKLVHFYNRIFCYRRGYIGFNEKHHNLKKFAMKIGLAIEKNDDDQILAEKILRFVQAKNKTSTMAPIASIYGFRKEMFPSFYYTELIPHQFEGELFPVSKFYDKILTQLYGDYMSPPPPEKQYENLEKYHFRLV